MLIPTPFVEPTPRRIRVRLGDELVADSNRAQLLVQYGTGSLPTYYLPNKDVPPGPVVDETTGPGGQRTWAVRAGGKRVEGAAWTHENPTGTMSALNGHVTFSWRQLEWYEEDERVVMHARDPYKRVDTLRSSRRVQVLVAGEQVADSVRPLLLFETSLPTRYYLPFEDVRTELLEASPENPKIRDLLCFFNERVDLVIDGEALERPVSPWSEPGPEPSDVAQLL